MAAATVLKETAYRPSEDEEFMNERQLEYFKQKLINWKEDILRESGETLKHLQTRRKIIPTLPTGPRRRPIALLNCAPVTGNAS